MDLDLVEVAPDATPPVCRIMDYNRFKYETAQRAKESKKKASNTSIKEMKYRPKIGTGDFSTKTRQVRVFLEEGHKVKVTIMFRGREVSHPELGMKILEDLAEQVATVGKVEAAAKMDGRNMTMVLAPDRRARQAATRKATDGQAPGEDRPADGAVPPAVPAAAAPAPAGPEGQDHLAQDGHRHEAPAHAGPAQDSPAQDGPAQDSPAQDSPAQARPAPAARVPSAAAAVGSTAH
jgi:translation initiation factor IF-3